MTEINIYKCEACGREFELGYQLEMHSEHIHKPTSVYKCEKCGQEFGMAHQLEMHLALYAHDAGDKPRFDYRGPKTAEPPRKLY